MCSGLSASKSTCMRVRRSLSLAVCMLLSCTGRSCSGSRGARQLLMVAARQHAHVTGSRADTHRNSLTLHEDPMDLEPEGILPYDACTH